MGYRKILLLFFFLCRSLHKGDYRQRRRETALPLPQEREGVKGDADLLEL